MTPLTWKDLEPPLLAAWQEAGGRGGSFADGPCEPGAGYDGTIGPVWELESLANAAIQTWIDTGHLPDLPPAANRYAEVRFICALGLLWNLALLPKSVPPPEWPLPKIYGWLLFDVHADTTQVALDHMRKDLLEDSEGEHAPE